LRTGDLPELRKHLEAALAEAIARDQVKREPLWTESLAVGSAGFVRKIQPLILSRRETEVTQTAEGFTLLQEASVPLQAESGAEKRR